MADASESQYPGRMNQIAALQMEGGRNTHLATREELLGTIQSIDTKLLLENDTFLVVINIADTKKYDEIIRIFGYNFVDDLLAVRLESLSFLTSKTKLYNIGFWSIGFILRPATYENFQSPLDRSSAVYKLFLDRLTEKLLEPVICRGIPMSITSGIGVCDLKKALGSAQDVLQATFMAGQVKNESSGAWSVCNYELAEDNRRAFAIISDVGHALATSGQFQLCYQPRTVVASGNCVGAEALLRWHHPTLGPVAPNEFIPLVERTGFIKQLTDWVLLHAIQQAQIWQNSGLDLKISVNISVRNLDEVDFVERIAGHLQRFGLKPESLELEFSESQAFSNFAVSTQRLQALRDLGVSIAIDDFGTGQNSFKYLQLIPANILKIDQSLISSLKGDPKKQNVVTSMIDMAHKIGLSVVGEGVESMEILEFLSASKCDQVQGYYISRPMYADEFQTWYQAQIR